VNCDANKDRTLTALGLVYGDLSYDLRGDGVAEDIILVISCFNTFTSESPPVWCLENGMVVQGVCICVTLPRVPLKAR
jgi:hypothetical protein